MKKNKKAHQTTIGIDPGGKQHAVCILGKDGEVLQEFSIGNQRGELLRLAQEHPKARAVMEVGTRSPWISRLMSQAGLEVIVASARKLRAIYDNERKCDKTDARMLAKLARVDKAMPHPISHIGEQGRRDLLLLKLRDTLARQRVALINSARACLKSQGLRLPLTTTTATA